MNARSRGVTFAFSATAFCTRSRAFGSSSAFIAALMFGPRTSAWPQYAIAALGIEPRGFGRTRARPPHG